MRTNAYILLLAALVSSGAYAQTRRNAKVVKKAATTKTATDKENSAMFEEMLPNTQKIFVIDSVVVDKSKVVESIPLPSDYGSIVPYNKFFSTTTHPDSYVFVNGFGNRCYYSETDASGASQLYMRDKLEGKWGKAQPLAGLDGMSAQMNYPYMTSDGTTLYFAAKSADGLGGYDIYVASYDPDNGKFLKAENVGLPFNSSSDDYLYVEDDADGFAWFATTRRQAEGKVCIYTIATSSSRQNYNIDELGENKTKSLASLERIRDTWPSPDQRDKAMKRLNAMKSRNGSKTSRNDISFVIDDKTTYRSIDNFAPENRQRFTTLSAEIKQLKENAAAIDAMRIKYHGASSSDKAKMKQELLSAERTQQQLQIKIAQDTKALRRSEAARQRE